MRNTCEKISIDNLFVKRYLFISKLIFRSTIKGGQNPPFIYNKLRNRIRKPYND